MIMSYENLYVILWILNLFTAISIYPISVDQGRGQGQVKVYQGQKGGGDETKVHETKFLIQTKLMRNASWIGAFWKDYPILVYSKHN